MDEIRDLLREGVAPADAEFHASGQDLFDLGMPPVGKSLVEARAKEQLYGGKSSLACTPLQFVARDHSFHREKVRELVSRIQSTDLPCTSFSLKARRGSGLSLALGQLVQIFAAEPHTVVLSVIGDRKRTLRLVNMLDEKKHAFVTWVKSLAPEKARVLIVIDDVWDARGEKPISDGRLVNLRNFCKEAILASQGPKLTFVFGSFGAASTLDENGHVELGLTDKDRDACYKKMAVEEPTILEGFGGSPPEARQIGDDAQALIDFYLENGRPYRSTVEHWLARIDDLSQTQQDILAIVAAAELLDLPVPEAVAAALCAKRGAGHEDAEEIVAENNRLMILDAQGPAVGLSCPWRARSILARSGRLTEAFLGPGFEELIEEALLVCDKGGAGAPQTREFVRHIFQRLGKREYYPFPDKGHIGSQIVVPFFDRVEILSRQWSVVETAKWAGSISPWLDATKGESPKERENRQRCAELVGRMVERCLLAVDRDAAALTPQTALSLLRATRHLCASRLFTVEDGTAETARLLAEHLDHNVRRAGIQVLLRHQLQEQSEDRGYRANEFITAYCRFQAELNRFAGGDLWFPPLSLCRDLSGILERACALLNQCRLSFDAGTRIECARFAWCPPEARRRSDWAVQERRRYLAMAQRSVDLNPIRLATWEERVRDACRRMLPRPSLLSRQGFDIAHA